MEGVTEFQRELQRDISTLLGKRIRNKTLFKHALMNGREVLLRQQKYEVPGLHRAYGRMLVGAVQFVHSWIGRYVARIMWRQKISAQLCDPLWGAGLACELLSLSKRHSDVERYLQLSVLLHSDLHIFDYYVALKLSGEDEKRVNKPTHAEETSAYMQLSEAVF
jgi:hypothetical protein